MFKSQAESATKISDIKKILDSPMQLYTMTEGRDRDLTWTQTLPTEALRLYVDHLMDLGQGAFLAEIRGALASVGQQYILEKFHNCSRVITKFITPFAIAYDSLSSVTAVAETTEERGNNDETSKGKVAESAQKAENEENNRHEDLLRFRTMCAEHCEREINSRLISLVATGKSIEIQNTDFSNELFAHHSSTCNQVVRKCSFAVVDVGCNT